ncbi:hypothetical protein [Yersinia ruckeri]|uniref:hypothetical protein n=1 Tax=Yersinia ruckeri TaxID=29486 RepID=UPI0012D38DA9|nr:hypothetical protein [Yersinia ruckeri]MCW6569723.1 hypothetical protein [Yersinia ruckeri]
MMLVIVGMPIQNKGVIVRLIVLVISLLSANITYAACTSPVTEQGLLHSIGVAPVTNNISKEQGAVKHTYHFRKASTPEDDFADDNAAWEPDFNIEVINPACISKVNVVFYVDDAQAKISSSNIKFASNAYGYLTGADVAIFHNQLNKLKEVQWFKPSTDRVDMYFWRNEGKPELYTIGFTFKGV